MTKISAEMIGATVEFNYGPMHGSERGTIVDLIEDRWGARLVVMTEEGAEKTVSSFTTVGIGAYLIETPAASVNRSSPWFREEA